MNRYFENKGDGTFTDKTAASGLTARVYNTQAIALADLNGGGKLDLLMANEGQESAILLGNKELPNKGTPLVVHVPGECLGGAAVVRVVGKDVRLARGSPAGTAAGSRASPRGSSSRRERTKWRSVTGRARRRPKT